MPRFFVDLTGGHGSGDGAPCRVEQNGREANAIGQDGRFAAKTITLTGNDALHLARSLRCRVGEFVTVCDFYNYEYRCKVESVAKDHVELSIIDRRPSDNEPDIEVVLYQALVKSDKFDTVVQKAVELGVSAVVPVDCRRCVSRPEEAALDKKRLRWQRISEQAAKQCGRAIIPQVRSVMRFEQVLRELAALNARGGCGFLCYENEQTLCLRQYLETHKPATAPANGRYGFVIGPEGGLDDDEIECARMHGVPMVTLGKRILRTETAPLFVLSAIMFFTGNMDG